MYENLYRELLLRYNELVRENTRLSEENLQLRREFGFEEIPEEKHLVRPLLPHIRTTIRNVLLC